MDAIATIGLNIIEGRKLLPEDDKKNFVSIRTKASHTQDNLRMLQLLCKMQLQTQYTPVQLRPHRHVPEEPSEFHAQESAGCHQEGGESYQVLGRYTQNGPFSVPNCINNELIKSTYTCGLILCGAQCKYRNYGMT